MTDTTLSAPLLLTADGTPLKTRLRRIERISQMKSLLLILPLILFLLLTFLAPIASMLVRSVDNPEVAPTLPNTVVAMRAWNKKSLPAEEAYAALVKDIIAAKEDPSQLAEAGKCLVSYDHISQRIQKLATAREVLGNLLADLKAQTS